MMLVSCLLPTFNRYPRLAYLVEEAVECFLRQDYADKELLICNDTPGQTLRFDHPQVRVINARDRFPTLGEKLHFMLEKARGEYICRWDDDDLSLPWRLSMSVTRMQSQQTKEWRPENHWYDPKGGLIKESKHPGNTHIMSIWHRGLITENQEATHSGRQLAPCQYPGARCPSGLEDQTFNAHIWALGYPRHGDLLPLNDIFYFYRWGTGSKHLSGRGGGDTMQESYKLLEKDPITEGTFDICPRWLQDHVKRAKDAATDTRYWADKPGAR